MQLCFSTLVCPDWNLPQIVGAAAAHDVQGVDFRGLPDDIDITRHPLFTADLAATLELLGRHGLKLPCLNTSVALMTPAADRWEMMLDECVRYARLAGHTQTHLLRIFGGEIPRGMSRHEALGLGVRRLRQLLKACGPGAPRLLVETHDDWSVSQHVMELVQSFEPQAVGVLWDVEHPFRRGEQPAQTAQILGQRIHHIHIKDSVRQSQQSCPRLLGEGELPLVQFLQVLRGGGYDQWICLETEKRWHRQTAPEPEDSIPQFVRFVRQNW
jgi:sugar phosphate isomerase/epimerase